LALRFLGSPLQPDFPSTWNAHALDRGECRDGGRDRPVSRRVHAGASDVPGRHAEMSEYLPYLVAGYAAAICFSTTQSWETMQIRRENLGPDAKPYRSLPAEIFAICFNALFYLPFA